MKSPKKLIAARLRKVQNITESFPVSGQFDAVAVIDVLELSAIKDITTEIQKIPGVERTETMVEVNPYYPNKNMLFCNDFLDFVD